MHRFIVLVCLLLSFEGTVLFPQDQNNSLASLSLENLLNKQVHSASKFWQYLNEVPASVTIVTSREMDVWGCASLAEVLSRVRSFYLSYDRNYTSLGVRGFGKVGDYNNRILLTINGHSLNENIYDGAYIGSDFGFPVEMIDRIEIVRGPGSSIYGASAVFAVINVITKTGAETNGFHLFSGGNSLKHFSYGLNYGNKFQNGLETFFSFGRFTSPGAEYYFQEFDTDTTFNGLTSGTDKEFSTAAFLSLAFKQFTLQSGGSRRKKNVPTAAYSTIFNDPDFVNTDNRFFLSLSFAEALSEELSLNARIAFDSYYFEGSYPYLESGIRKINLEKSIGRWVIGETRAKWDVTDNNSLLAGIEVQRHLDAVYEFGFINSLEYRVNSPIWLTSAYLQDDLRFDNGLSVSLGARFDKFEGRNSELSPRIGIIYNSSPTQTYKLLYGTTFRKPNLYEQYYEDPATGFLKSQNLKAEHIRSWEVIAEHKISSDALMVFSAYYNTMSHLIDVFINPDTEEQQYENSPLVSSIGAECSFDLHLNAGFRGYVSTGIYRTNDENTGKRLTNSPEVSFKWNLSYHLSSFSFLSLSGLFESQRTLTSGFSTPSFLVHDLGFVSSLFDKNFEVSVFVKNIFNVAVFHPTGPEILMPSLRQDGRHAIIKVGYNLH